MVHELEHGLAESALASLVGRAAAGVAAGTSVLLALALANEMLRRRNRARRLITLLDAALPGGIRTAAVSLLAVAASLTGMRPAAADESVRGWLGRPTTSTTRPAPIATPEAIDELVEPSPSPPRTGPVVLIPPAVEESPRPGPVAPIAPAPVPTPPAEAAAPELANYVVQPGDCLWAIAARRLGPAADGRAIDAGWRRIYETNRAAVGDNPSLIHIGLVLRLPPLDTQP